MMVRSIKTTSSYPRVIFTGVNDTHIHIAVSFNQKPSNTLNVHITGPGTDYHQTTRTLTPPGEQSNAWVFSLTLEYANAHTPGMYKFEFKNGQQTFAIELPLPIA